MTQEVIHGGAEGPVGPHQRHHAQVAQGIDQVDAKEEEEQQRVDVCAVRQAEEEERWAGGEVGQGHGVAATVGALRERGDSPM